MMRRVAGPLRVAHVSPFVWEDEHEVNTYVREVTARLAQRGHRVLVLAPSRDGSAVRAVRDALRRGAVDDLAGRDFLAVGEALPVPAAPRGRAALPVDVARTVEELLGALALDVVHVHEPFAPSVASAALRHSRALNVGTFHAPAERLVATQVARKLVEARLRPPGRPPGRVRRHGGAPRALLPRRVRDRGARRRRGGAAASADGGPVRIALVDDEERAALRTFLRALRRLPRELDWEATVVSARGPSSTTPLRADLRERVAFTTDGAAERAGRRRPRRPGLRRRRPDPALLLRAIAAGAVPVASRLPVYEELARGRTACCSSPATPRPSPASSSAWCATPRCASRRRAAARTRPGRGTRSRTSVEAVLRRLEARRHDPAGNPVLWQRLRRRRLIDVDLHMHTDHSHDCATPVEHLLATARDQGLGAIAITDHNEISGALEAAEKAERVRRQGDRRRGGQDRLPGRGHRPLPQGEDPARA